MERKSKLSISLTLTIIATLVLGFAGLVYAAPPNADYPQPITFDSRPTTGAYSGVGTPTGPITNAFDGFLDTSINWIYGSSAAGVVSVTGFNKPSDMGRIDFPITFIDIVVDYRIACAAAAIPDEYRLVFTLGADTVELVPWTQATKANWTGGLQGQGHGARVFSNVARPGGGVWAWGELAQLTVALQTRVVSTSDFQRAYLHEVWITARAVEAPTGELQMYVIPSYIGPLDPGNSIYFDIYVTGVSRLWGYEFVLQFDPAQLVPMEYFSYGPFINSLPSEIGPDYFAVAFKTFDGDPNGFTGNTPITRIYFGIADVGHSLLHFTKASGADVVATPLFFAPHDGGYNVAPPVPEFPLGLGIVMLLIPAFPVVYLWRMRKKERA